MNFQKYEFQEPNNRPKHYRNKPAYLEIRTTDLKATPKVSAKKIDEPYRIYSARNINKTN